MAAQPRFAGLPKSNAQHGRPRARHALRLGVPIVLTVLLLGLVWTVTGSADNIGSRDDRRPHSASALATAWSNFYPDGWSNRLPLSSGITASDTRGLNPSTAAYRLSTDGGLSWTLWGTSNLSTIVEDTTTVRIAVDNLSFADSATLNRIQFRIETVDGEPSVSDSYTIAVDTMAPGSPYGLQSYPDTWTNVNAFDERWTNPIDLSGIAGVYYRLDREPVGPTDGTFVATGNVLTDLQVPYEGKHTIYLWLVDGAGNVDHRTRNIDPDAFRYDATAPTVDVAPNGTQGNNGWYISPVTVNFTPQDALSGIDAWGWVLDGARTGNATTLVINDDLVHSLVVTATDVAGNSMQPTTRVIPLDATPPLLGYSVVSRMTPSAAGWYTAPLTITFSLTDAVSGPDRISWRLDNGSPSTDTRVVIAEDGEHTVQAFGLDQAGNASAQLQLSLPLDSAAPNTTAAVTPPMAASGYYTAPVTVRLTPIDPVSGVSVTWLRVGKGPWQARTTQQIAQDGRYTIDYYSVDVAGNVEISRSLAITVDANAPTTPLTAAVEPQGWSADNSFALRWQNPADFSGVVGAYVHLGATPPRASDGAFYRLPFPFAPVAELLGLAAPAEGEWPVWLWLVDGAGNARRDSARMVGVLRHDATAPQLAVEARGVPGNDGWFTSPVTLTLTISDTGSGPRFLRYRLDGSPWQQSNEPVVSLPALTRPGKHVLDYYGEDIAGTIGGPFMHTVRIDPDAPGAPLALAVEPAQWSNTDQFTVTWRNPLDVSGIAKAYFSLTPPLNPTYGQAIAADAAQVLTAPGEGAHDLYLWLEDRAGNVGSPAHLAAALRYDATPPLTLLRLSSQPNAAGWFRSGVGVSFDVVDDLSGVAQTVWQLDDQPPSTAGWLFVEGDGLHTLTFYSVDRAGNVETPPKRQIIKIDSQEPTAHLSALPIYSATPLFGVRWDGDDGPLAVIATEAGPTDASRAIEGYTPGSSGVAVYNVQVRRGASGLWEPWLNETPLTQAVFPGQRGQSYTFRVQAVDLAGNHSAWSTGAERNRVFVDAIENGYFATNNFDGWQTQPDLGMGIVLDNRLMSGATVPVGRLGWQGWEACSRPGNLPTPACTDTQSSIAQTIRIPPLTELPRPQLSVWYRVQSYDVISTTAPSLIRLCDPTASFLWADTFDVTVTPEGSGAGQLLLRTGNRTPPDFSGPNPPIPLRDLGWQIAVFDMSAYAGQTVRVELSTHNRIDARFNTWTDVYAIRLGGERRKVFLPLVASRDAAPPETPTVCYPLGAPASTMMTPLPSDAARLTAEDPPR